MMDKITIDGVTYSITPVPDGAQYNGATVTINGVVYALDMAQDVDRINADGKTHNIADAPLRSTVAGLQTAIEAEMVRAQDAEQANADAIVTEASRAQGAESALQQNITAETVRAQYAEQTLDGKITAEVERAVQAEQTLDGKITAEAERAVQAEQEIKSKAVDADSLNFQTRNNEVALDYKTIEGKNKEITISAATTKTAGVMSAEDKKSLDTATSRALRTLFIAAGAEYNDTGADITKTTLWGETVTHKAGHYYLNGLGDITEAQMMNIYNRGAFNDSEKSPLGYNANKLNQVRTNLCRVGMWNGSLSSYLCAVNTTIEVVNLHVINSNSIKDTCAISFPDTESLFNGASKLSVIDTRCLLSYATWKDTSFNGCKKLKEVRIKSLKNNIVFKDSSILSKATVLYMIQNAAPTTAITITLHSDAYARLAEDADIVSALEAQPLITLVSA